MTWTILIGWRTLYKESNQEIEFILRLDTELFISMQKERVKKFSFFF